MPKKEKHGIHSKRAFLTGFVALFPLVLTFVVLQMIWKFILSPISVPLGELLTEAVIKFTPLKAPPAWYAWLGTLAALALAVVVVYFLGLVLATFIGRAFLRWWDRILTRLPLISSIYPHAKQLSNFLFGKRKMGFNRVVAIEYPRKGVYSLGFVTSNGPAAVSRQSGEEMLAVFVPTSPTPITGWTVMVPADEVINMDMTMDEAVRFTVSCGVLVPGKEPLDKLPAPEGTKEPETIAPEDTKITEL